MNNTIGKQGVKRNILLIIGIIGFFSVKLQAQDHPFMENDSIRVSDGFIAFSDTLALVSLFDRPVAKSFVSNPTKAVIYSAIFPGLGQIYNRKYWKLPIVYGAAAGCIYAVTWNGTQSKGYRDAYRDLFAAEPKGESWKAYRPESYGFDAQTGTWRDARQKIEFGNYLKRRKDIFRRDYELSLIVSVGVYLLCMIDAYVDAHLFEFDVSEDLSFKMEPVLFERTIASSRSFGLQCSVTF